MSFFKVIVVKVIPNCLAIFTSLNSSHCYYIFLELTMLQRPRSVNSTIYQDIEQPPKHVSRQIGQTKRIYMYVEWLSQAHLGTAM